MKHVLPQLLFVLAALALAVASVACRGGDVEGPPIELQQQDRDQITRMTSDYLAALDARDMAKAMAQLPAGVPNATVTKAMDTFENEGYQLVSIGDITVDGQDVVVTLNLKDKTGKAITRTFEFRIDQGQWKLWSPQLKLPA